MLIQNIPFNHIIQKFIPLICVSESLHQCRMIYIVDWCPEYYQRVLIPPLILLFDDMLTRWDLCHLNATKFFTDTHIIPTPGAHRKKDTTPKAVSFFSPQILYRAKSDQITRRMVDRDMFINHRDKLHNIKWLGNMTVHTALYMHAFVFFPGVCA